jgi:site-specific DNA-methyltransferase (adenine-specific)
VDTDTYVDFHKMTNRLYLGDNLDILRDRIETESVDLIYLDPPFNSAKNYNLLFNEEDGTKAAAQRLVFGDTWTWNQESAALFEEMVRAGGRVADVLEAFRTFLGNTTMLAYLTMMAPRLVELRRVLKKTGSVYLHCDQTASHYLKLLMDSVFGPTCYRNEIIWSYRRWPSPANHFQRMHDTLLFYSRESNGPGTFNVQYEANSESYIKRFKGKTQVLDPETKTRKLTVDAPSKGLPMRDVWDIKIIPGSGKERLGYPTQKPEALLERILAVSATKETVVLDPFCGCGTTVAVAERMKLPWIGIDIAHPAIAVIRHRLGPSVEFEFDGDPKTVTDLRALAAADPFIFQFWAVGLLYGFPADFKKGADRGIDGKISFHDEPTGGRAKHIVISVKSGKPNVEHVRSLLGVIERDKANIGVLVTLEPPTRQMELEAASAGFYESYWWRSRHPRIQIIQGEQLLGGKRIDFPSPSDTFEARKKPPLGVNQPEQMRLLKF